MKTDVRKATGKEAGDSVTVRIQERLGSRPLRARSPRLADGAGTLEGFRAAKGSGQTEEVPPAPTCTERT